MSNLKEKNRPPVFTVSDSQRYHLNICMTKNEWDTHVFNFKNWLFLILVSLKMWIENFPCLLELKLFKLKKHSIFHIFVQSKVKKGTVVNRTYLWKLDSLEITPTVPLKVVKCRYTLCLLNPPHNHRRSDQVLDSWRLTFHVQVLFRGL